MKFTPTDPINANGTSLRGYVTATYQQLVDVLGDPQHGPNCYDHDKITCEWVLKLEDGTIVTIYDYKCNETPTCEYQWHVGGHPSKGAVRKLNRIIAPLEATDSYPN